MYSISRGVTVPSQSLHPLHRFLYALYGEYGISLGLYPDSQYFAQSFELFNFSKYTNFFASENDLHFTVGLQVFNAGYLKSIPSDV
jgi:hypothetical protein